MKMFYEILMDFMSKNQDIFFEKKSLELNMFILKPEFEGNFKSMINEFLRLSDNIDVSDLEIFMPYLNYLLDINEKWSRDMIRVLRE